MGYSTFTSAVVVANDRRHVAFEALFSGDGKSRGMDIDRETIVEAAAASVPVLIVIAIFVVIGNSFTADSSLSPSGGQALVGAIVAFVFLMFAVGLYLSRIRPDGNGNPNGS